MTIPNQADGKIRRGLENKAGLPADPALMIFAQRPTSHGVGPTAASVENTNITGETHVSASIPGKTLTLGDAVAVSDADGFFPCLMTALKRHSAVEDLGGGAFKYRLSELESIDSSQTYSTEFDRGDELNALQVGTATTALAMTLAKDAATSLTVTEATTYTTEWGTAEQRHPNPTSTDPATFALFFRGVADKWLDRQDGDSGNLSVKLVDVFTATDGISHGIFLARSGVVGPPAGTWTVVISENTYVGVSGDAKNDLVIGDVIKVAGDFVTVSSVLGANSFETTENHSAGAAAVSIEREYGYTADGRLDFTDIEIGLNPQLERPLWSKLRHSAGNFMGKRATSGQTVEMFMRTLTGVVAGTPGAVGTVAVAAGSDQLTGDGTSFLADLRIGDLVTTDLDTVGKRIRRIDDDTTAFTQGNYATVEAATTLIDKPIPQVDLSGTITTNASATVAGAGTSFLTELAPGSWLRTIGGEVRRVLAIANDTSLTVVEPFANSEAAVAATTDYEWIVPRVRTDWVATTHASGVFPEVLAGTRLFLSGTAIPEFEISLAVESLAFTWTAATVQLTGTGSVHASAVVTQGQSSGTITLTIQKADTTIRKAIRGQENARIKMFLPTGKVIGTSTEEYQWLFVFQVKAEGQAVLLPDGVTNQEVLTGPLFNNPEDAEWPAAFAAEIISDNPNPFATTP